MTKAQKGPERTPLVTHDEAFKVAKWVVEKRMRNMVAERRDLFHELTLMANELEMHPEVVIAIASDVLRDYSRR